MFTNHEYTQILDEQQRFKGTGHTGQINSIFYDKQDTLFTCGVDGQIISWSIKKLSQTSAMKVDTDISHSILVVPNTKTIVIGGRQLKSWNLVNNELIQTFAGHTSNITITRHIYHDGKDYILTGSSNDRILSLWCLDGEASKKNSVATFLMEDLAISVSSLLTEKEGQLKLVAVTRTGVVHYFVETFSTMRSAKPIKPKVTVKIVAESTQVVDQIPSIVATLEFQRDANEILIGYGAKQFLHFERIIPDLSTKNQIEIRMDPRKISKKVSAKEQANRDLNTVVPLIDHQAVEYLTNETTMPRKSVTKVIELPMETRLENLSVGAAVVGGAPQKNMAQLLVQGLHSQDAAILKLVFACTDEKSIELTLQKLPPMYINSLVMELTALMRKKTQHVQTATKWLKYLFHSHSSQLMALGPNELYNNFGDCMGIIETRVDNLKTLSRLRGRLNLLCSQMQRKGHIENSGLNDSNLLVFQDKDSSDDEGVAESESSDNDNWEEDESDDDNGKETKSEKDVDEESEMDVSD